MDESLAAKRTKPLTVGERLAQLHAKVQAEEQAKPRCPEEHTVRGIRFMCVWKAGHWMEEHMDRKGRIWKLS